MEKEMIQDTRLELEILEKSAQEKKFTQEKEKNKEEARLSFIRGLDDQVKYVQYKTFLYRLKFCPSLYTSSWYCIFLSVIPPCAHFSLSLSLWLYLCT